MRVGNPAVAGESMSGPVRAARQRSIGRELRGILVTFSRVLAGYVVLAAIVTIVKFPYHTDDTKLRSIPPQADEYYARIYTPPAKPDAKPGSDSPDQYVAIAKESISAFGVIPVVKDFVQRYHLEKARVLDVGAGTGYLQDVVPNYVGLDISAEAARFYHKPFIHASATEMPVPDNEFDLIWSIFVLEHVPNPEQALVEIRRAAKDGGILFLAPAWDCEAWAADGYPVRPYSDLDWKGKFYKAGIVALEYAPFKTLSRVMTRTALRAGRIGSGPTRLHYRPIKPNYEKYWMADSDAINSIDRDEMRMWFTSRGDECLNCDDSLTSVSELIIKVHKK